jgi:hypothetical protein
LYSRVHPPEREHKLQQKSSFLHGKRSNQSIRSHARRICNDLRVSEENPINQTTQRSKEKNGRGSLV